MFHSAGRILSQIELARAERHHEPNWRKTKLALAILLDVIGVCIVLLLVVANIMLGTADWPDDSWIGWGPILKQDALHGAVALLALICARLLHRSAKRFK